MNNRAYQQWRNSTRSINKLVPKPTISSITVYISLLFTFSIIVFFFSSRQIPDNEDPDLSIPDDPPPQARQLPGQELWGAHNSGYHSCVDPTPSYKEAQASNRYITVRSNGGLNQMRTGISDMVVVARIMNATLVIPQLDKKSFWSDSSTFSDIFDELHFMTFLQRDVHIVRELPKGLESVPRARKHFTSWSSESYYKEMNHLWNDYQVIHVAKSDSRLANNDLPLDIQRLRCRALYHALQFAPPIERLGKVLSIHNGETTEAGGAPEITRGEVYCSSSTL